MGYSDELNRSIQEDRRLARLELDRWNKADIAASVCGVALAVVGTPLALVLIGISGAALAAAWGARVRIGDSLVSFWDSATNLPRGIALERDPLTTQVVFSTSGEGAYRHASYRGRAAAGDIWLGSQVVTATDAVQVDTANKDQLEGGPVALRLAAPTVRVDTPISQLHPQADADWAFGPLANGGKIIWSWAPNPVIPQAEWQGDQWALQTRYFFYQKKDGTMHKVPEGGADYWLEIQTVYPLFYKGIRSNHKGHYEPFMIPVVRYWGPQKVGI